MRSFLPFVLLFCMLPALHAAEMPLDAARWTAADGALAAGADGTLRWSAESGQTSRLALTDAAAREVKNYDELRLEWRVASGELDGFNVSALGNVSGPRRSRVHQWHLGAGAEPPGAWHEATLDLARPAWLPFANPDGEPSADALYLQTMARAPGSVIEIRRARLVRAALLLKPDWEAPVTWPLKTENPDGSATYRLTWQVLNTALHRADLEAEVISPPGRFQLALEKGKVDNVAAADKAVFSLSATLSQADRAALPELYREPLELRFFVSGAPESARVWKGGLVRPLAPGLRHELIIAPTALRELRTRLVTGDPAAKKLTKFDQVIKRADETAALRFESIPGGNRQPFTRFPPLESDPKRTWKIGSFMPEIVEPVTGAREVGTPLAAEVWKFYFAGFGALENLGTAYLLTGDEKYARTGVAVLELYGRQYAALPLRDTLDVPWSAGPNLLNSSRTANSSSYGGNWNFKGMMKLLAAIGESEAWQAADRATVYTGFVLPYAVETIKFPGGINNMSDIASCNQLIAGLQCDDATLVHWALFRSSGLLPRLDELDTDSFSSEGRPVSYHWAAMDEYVPALGYLANSGLAVPGFNRPKVLAAFKMPYSRATLTGRVPNAGDMGRGLVVGSHHLADALVPLFPAEKWLLELGTASTLPAQAALLAAGKTADKESWKTLLETKPRLYQEAGFAILRTGETAPSQVMVTHDWGRSVAHDSLGRQQITLSAFGKVFTHGPGSLYNVGNGGITRNVNPRLEAFLGYNSLSHNIIVVDGHDQQRTAGRLVQSQLAGNRLWTVARLEGATAGVAHTRAVALWQGIVLLLDRVESADEHTYDWTYHNFGVLTLGEGWSAHPLARPFGESTVYQSVLEPARLQPADPQITLRLKWDLTEQANPFEKEAPAPVFLHFFHGTPGAASGEVFTGATGLNNPNTMIMPDAAPSVFHRVKARQADFWTVLEPARGPSRIAKITPGPAGVVVDLQEGPHCEVTFAELGFR